MAKVTAKFEKWFRELVDKEELRSLDDWGSSILWEPNAQWVAYQAYQKGLKEGKEKKKDGGSK